MEDRHNNARRSASRRGRTSRRSWLSGPRPVLLAGISILVTACGAYGGTAPGASGSATQTQPAQTSSPAEAASTGRWKLTWSSSFNRPGALNKWLFYSGGTGFGGAQLEWYDAANASINDDGQLVITADKGGSANKCWYGPCQYTSARLETKNTFTQTYGEFEARIKFPVAKGLWPAFWIEGADVYQVGWPACGEVDIAEINGSSPYLVLASAHAPHRFKHPASLVSSQPINDSFNTYAVIWNPQGITWYFNGHEFSHMDSYSGWPFDKPFFIILNLAVGGGYVGRPDASTPFPAQMVVDWVRVYRHVDG